MSSGGTLLPPPDGLLPPPPVPPVGCREGWLSFFLKGNQLGMSRALSRGLAWAVRAYPRLGEDCIAARFGARGVAYTHERGSIVALDSPIPRPGAAPPRAA